MTQTDQSETDEITGPDSEFDAAAESFSRPRWANVRRFMTDLPTSSRRIERWGMNPEDRARVMEQCLLLRKPGWKFNFGLMMLMSVIVAIMGLSANSAAVVIGAMLMAPLMTPVLGVAAALSMALGPALVRSLTTVLLASFGAIALSYAAGWFLPDGRGTLSAEILARTQPDVRDLFIALAAGVAGSYATARPDTSSSLPGVAIAVALVPPLAVIGLTWEAGETTLAQGAALLFLTNLAAIVAASAVVFLSTGFVPGTRIQDMRPTIIVGGLVAAGLLAVVTWQLTQTTLVTIDRISTEREVEAQIRAWLDGTGDSLDQFTVDREENRVTVKVSGPTPLPPTHPLEEKLASSFDGPVTVNATRVPVQTRNSGDPIDADAVRAEVQAWIDEQSNSASFEIASLDVTVDSVRVIISVEGAAPDPTELERSLSAEFAAEALVKFDEQQPAEQPVDVRLATTGRIRAIADEWAQSQGDGRIDDLSVKFDEDQVAVVELTFAGPVAPNLNLLREELWTREGYDGQVELYFTQRQRIDGQVQVVPIESTEDDETNDEPAPTPTPDGG